MTARYLPDVLLVPHLMIDRNFKSGVEGERKVVDYFFTDSPTDYKLVQDNPFYYDITRDIIDYSFQDVPRLVKDVCRWAGDWSDLLSDVAQTRQVTFVQGTKNNMFSCESIRNYLPSLENADLLNIEGAGQLLLYTHSDHIVRKLANH
jgi:hypothetical protein